MANNLHESMTIVDPDFYEDDDEIVGGDANELIPIEMDENGFGEDPEYTTPDYTTEADAERINDPIGNETPPSEDDIVTALLRAKGISNPHEISFEEEDGTESKKDFYSLSKEEQLELLQTNDLDDNYGLDENEVDAVNFLRENNVTLQEVIDYYQQQAIEAYKNNNAEAAFEIDNYTDEELYVIDLKTKFDELTNEELEVELTKALETPDLFKKKVDRLRTDYKSLEEQNKTANEQVAKATQEEAYEKITNSLIDVANGVDDLFGIDLEIQDKEDIINSIVDRDLNGVTPLAKLLDNPANLFKAAWFVTKGEEAFSLLHNYYRKEIEDIRKSSYQKGKAEALKGFPTQPINRIGSTPNRSAPTPQPFKARTIDDLHNIND